MARIAVVGPGAIGGALAAWLADSGRHEVELCARTPFERLFVQTPARSFELKLPVHTNPAECAPVDWVILATKTYQVAAASKWFADLCDDRTRVAVTQNGVEHVANLAPHFDADRVVPVVIDLPAEHEAAGRVVQHGGITMTLPDNEDSAEFRELFDDPSIEITLTESWVSAAWQKLCTNSAGAVSAITNRPVNVARDEAAAAAMTALIRECIAVGRAEGAQIDDSIVEYVLETQRRAPDGAVNSLHADRLAGRPMEWRARNGVIVRLGEQHGIATPCNRMAADLLSAIEAANA